MIEAFGSCIALGGVLIVIVRSVKKRLTHPREGCKSCSGCSNNSGSCSPIPLTEMARGCRYEIADFSTDAHAYSEKLYKMGFVEGTPVSSSPVKLDDPIIVHIRGSRIALRKDEAHDILVREVTHA